MQLPPQLLPFVAALTLLSGAAGIPAQERDIFAVDIGQVAPGVFVATRPDGTTRPPVEGNVILILNATDVVVVDAAGLPTRARRILEHLRRMTDNPVRYLINTHGHGDHTNANFVWQDAFPGVDIVSHVTWRERLATGGLESRYDFIRLRAETPEAALEAYERRMETWGDDPAIAAYLRRYYEGDLYVQSEDYGAIRVILPPTITVDEGMTIHRGDRSIEVRHLGHGDTPSDLVVWLPAERVVATGDMVTHPIPYGFSRQPLEWRQTLGRLEQLDFQMLIPGHGEVLTGKEYLRRVMALLDGTIAQVRAAVEKGLTEEETLRTVDLTEAAAEFTGDDPVLAYLFEAWFRTPVVGRTYQQITGERDVEGN